MIFLLIWIVLTEGSGKAVIYAAPVSAGTALISMRLHPPANARIGLPALLLFIIRLVRLALLGGIDVAARALRPSLPIDPDFLTYARKDPVDRVGIALAYAMSLQPGTLIVRFEPHGLRFHTIDRTISAKPVIEAAERQLRNAFPNASERANA